MKVRYENIPPELTRLDRWVVWRGEMRNGKMTKPPYVADAGKMRHALVNRSSTWSTFAKAKEVCESGEFDGIGFVLGEGIFGIDYDNVDPALQKEALDLGTYAEWSPSGHGIHVIGRSGLQLKGRKEGSVELYMQGRYFTVTGNILEGSPPDVREVPDDRLLAFFRSHFTPG